MSALPTLAYIAQYTNSNNGGGSPAIAIFYLLVFVTFVTGLWKTFQKAGQPGWAAIIPIYNLVVLCWVAKKSGWFAVGLCVPLVNIVFFALISFRVAKLFGKGAGMAILLFFNIGYLFTGFGDAKYQPDLLK